MTPIRFAGHNMVFAENQSEYQPLPAHISDAGIATFAWRLTFRERLQLLFKGILWHQVMTFRQPLQPQLLHATKPEL